jgi:hypothetical protein
MKKLLLILTFIVMASASFSQSKKKQIEILNSRVDSLNQLVISERNTNYQKISDLNSNLREATNQNDLALEEISSLKAKIRIKTDSLTLVQLELKKHRNVNIPDAIFKAYLLGNSLINTNGDTEIQVSEAAAFNGGIHCPSMSISNLTGIEAFTALDTLNCSSNQLTSLDVSQNTALTALSCKKNQLTSINVSQNTSLTILVCGGNQLSSLNVSQNTALAGLSCSQNQLTSLNVSENTALTILVCGGNQLSSLNVSQNTALTGLDCSDNQLTSLNLSQNTALTTLYCKSNQLTSLNLSQNTALELLRCNGNQFDCDALKKKYNIKTEED